MWNPHAIRASWKLNASHEFSMVGLAAISDIGPGVVGLAVGWRWIHFVQAEDVFSTAKKLFENPPREYPGYNINRFAYELELLRPELIPGRVKDLTRAFGRPPRLG